MNKFILPYGLIAGLVIVLMLVLTFTVFPIDLKNGEFLGYATMIIAFSTIFIAVKSYRDKHLDGSIDFLKALRIGLAITLVATVIYVVAWMIMSETIAQDFMTVYFQQSIENLKASDLSQVEIDQKIVEMEEFKEMYKNPIVKMGMTAMEIFPVGFLISLISAFILKRKASN